MHSKISCFVCAVWTLFSQLFVFVIVKKQSPSFYNVMHASFIEQSDFFLPPKELPFPPTHATHSRHCFAIFFNVTSIALYDTCEKLPTGAISIMSTVNRTEWVSEWVYMFSWRYGLVYSDICLFIQSISVRSFAFVVRSIDFRSSLTFNK